MQRRLRTAVGIFCNKCSKCPERLALGNKFRPFSELTYLNSFNSLLHRLPTFLASETSLLARLLLVSYCVARFLAVFRPRFGDPCPTTSDNF